MRMILALVIALLSCGRPPQANPYQLDQPLTIAQLEGVWLRGGEQLELRSNGTYTRSWKAVEANASRNANPACTVSGTFTLSSAEQMLTFTPTTDCDGAAVVRNEYSPRPEEIRIMKIDAESFHVNDSDRTSFWRPEAVARQTARIEQEIADSRARVEAERAAEEAKAATHTDVAISAPVATATPAKPNPDFLPRSGCEAIMVLMCTRLSGHVVAIDEDRGEWIGRCAKKASGDLLSGCMKVPCGRRYYSCNLSPPASDPDCLGLVKACEKEY